MAIGRDTREIVGLYIGDRSAQSAQHLWDSLPLDYRETPPSYTDFWEAYAAVFPTTGHLAVGKETCKTNHIERYNKYASAARFSTGKKSTAFLEKA